MMINAFQKFLFGGGWGRLLGTLVCVAALTPMARAQARPPLPCQVHSLAVMVDASKSNDVKDNFHNLEMLAHKLIELDLNTHGYKKGLYLCTSVLVFKVKVVEMRGPFCGSASEALHALLEAKAELAKLSYDSEKNDGTAGGLALLGANSLFKESDSLIKQNLGDEGISKAFKRHAVFLTDGDWIRRSELPPGETAKDRGLLYPYNKGMQVYAVPVPLRESEYKEERGGVPDFETIGPQGMAQDGPSMARKLYNIGFKCPKLPGA